MLLSHSFGLIGMQRKKRGCLWQCILHLLKNEIQVAAGWNLNVELGLKTSELFLQPLGGTWCCFSSLLTLRGFSGQYVISQRMGLYKFICTLLA